MLVISSHAINIKTRKSLLLERRVQRTGSENIQEVLIEKFWRVRLEIFIKFTQSEFLIWKRGRSSQNRGAKRYFLAHGHSISPTMQKTQLFHEISALFPCQVSTGYTNFQRMETKLDIEPGPILMLQASLMDQLSETLGWVCPLGGEKMRFSFESEGRACSRAQDSGPSNPPLQAFVDSERMKALKRKPNQGLIYFKS